jgi:hypothetical protein
MPTSLTPSYSAGVVKSFPWDWGSLTSSTDHSFEVTASNGAGQGAHSACSNATTAATPLVPAGLSMDVGGPANSLYMGLGRAPLEVQTLVTGAAVLATLVGTASRALVLVVRIGSGKRRVPIEDLTWLE